MEGMNLKLKRWIAAATAAALTVALTGCTLKTPETVMTVDGVEVPAGVYLIYQLNAYSDAESQLDEDATMKNGEIDGEKASDWVHNKTVEDLRRWVWIDREFEAQGMTLEGDELSDAQSQAKSAYESNEEWYSENGIGSESYEKFYLAEVKYQKLYEAYEENDAEISVADAEAYMDENYIHISSVALPVSDGEGNAVTEEVLEEINGYAQDLVDQLNAGGILTDLAEETVKKAMEACGREYTEDTLSSLMLDGFASDLSTGYFSEETVEQMRGQEVGKAVLREDMSVPMICQRLPNYEDDEEFESLYYDQIVSLMRQQAYQDKATQESSEYAVEEDSSAVRAYSINNIKEK